jgi:hypothetical protein
MVLTPGRQRPRPTQTHRIEPSFAFWLSVSKFGRLLRVLMSIAPFLLGAGLGAALYGDSGLWAGAVFGIAVGLAVHSAVAPPGSFRS